MQKVRNITGLVDFILCTYTMCYAYSHACMHIIQYGSQGHINIGTAIMTIISLNIVIIKGLMINHIANINYYYIIKYSVSGSKPSF